MNQAEGDNDDDGVDIQFDYGNEEEKKKEEKKEEEFDSSENWLLNDDEIDNL